MTSVKLAEDYNAEDVEDVEDAEDVEDGGGKQWEDMARQRGARALEFGISFDLFV